MVSKRSGFGQDFLVALAYSCRMPRSRMQENAAPAPTSAASSSFSAPLSPHWAFVVQLREGTALTATAIHGRIEHIVSGQQAYFSSLEDLRACMERMLTVTKENPPSPHNEFRKH